MRPDLASSRFELAWNQQVGNELTLRGESRKNDQRIGRIESSSDDLILNHFNLLIVSNGSRVVGAEEYWQEHTEEGSYATKALDNNEQILTSPPIPMIASSRASNYHNSSCQFQLDLDNNVDLHPFDPAFSPPYYTSSTTSPHTSYSSTNVDLSSPPSPSNTLTNQYTTFTRPDSPPIEPYDQHPSTNTLKTNSNPYKTESYTPEISEPTRFVDDGKNDKARLIEMSTQTEGLEENKGERGRSRSASRGRNSSRHRRSSNSSSTSSTSSKRPLGNEHQRGRSMSRPSTIPHYSVIMPLPSSPILRNHSSGRQQYQHQRTPSSSSPSPPLSPSNSFSSVTSLEDTDEELDGAEGEEESFEYDARFIDLPSLKNGLKERDPMNRSSSRTELYCGEKYRLLAINKAKFARTGAGYFNGVFNLE